MSVALNERVDYADSPDPCDRSPHQRRDVIAAVVATLAVPVVLNQHKENLTEMHFDETPVSEVLSMLQKAYDIEINFQKEALSGCVLTSSFYEEGLYDRIDVICTAIGATYQIVDAQIVIESQGCNLKTE